MEIWDAIIIGGGPAGLSAAQMLGRSRRRVLVVDDGLPRNRFAAHMHGVLGYDGLSPQQLATRGRHEASQYGVEFLDGRVEHVEPNAAGVDVELRDHTERLHTRALIVATGVSDRLPDVPGLTERWGHTVLHCPYCHGWEVRDARIGVLLSSAAGLHQAELVRQLSPSTTIFTAAAGEIEIAALSRLQTRGATIVDAEVEEILGEGTAMSGVRTSDGAVVDIDVLFAAGELIPHDGFLAGVNLRRIDGPMGNLLDVSPLGQTSNAHIWAVGNVVTPYANVPMSMGAGSMTGAAVNAALVSAEFDAAEAAVAASVGASAPENGPAAVAPVTFWDQRYREDERIWSGNPNASLISAASDLGVGVAVDLGCGEGADALWLAERGWSVTGIDISSVAISRAQAAAEALKIPGTRFLAADLASWSPEMPVNLVTASFFHAPVELPRVEILTRAAAWIAPGGHLLVIGHAAMPPWAKSLDAHHHVFLDAAQELESLGLDPEKWRVIVAENRTRSAKAPSGEHTHLEDSVVLVQRFS